MKITALVENQTNNELKAKHGLSLYIETDKHRILFDLGPDHTLFDNAALANIDLTSVDTVIISHGHADHGGALEQFLNINATAKIYVQRAAFDAHYSKFLFFKVSIGIDHKFVNHPQIMLADGDYQIDEELFLFTAKSTDRCYSNANDALYSKDGKDNFCHEQNLIIRENTTALITGCGHTGIVNILETARTFAPRLCVGGYHLFNPLTRKTVPEALLDQISSEMQQYPDIRFYTCHCTGADAFRYLADRIPNLSYLSCGDIIEDKSF